VYILTPKGKSILPLLQIKPSPVLQVILHAVRVCQLDHPHATKDEVEAWVKGQWESEKRAEWEASAPQAVVKGKKRKGGGA
jgi:tRNA nucleotidyltransferase (CCA-adding enzyme)